MQNETWGLKKEKDFLDSLGKHCINPEFPLRQYNLQRRIYLLETYISVAPRCRQRWKMEAAVYAQELLEQARQLLTGQP